jgi:hypothetical protein
MYMLNVVSEKALPGKVIRAACVYNIIHRQYGRGGGKAHNGTHGND